MTFRRQTRSIAEQLVVPFTGEGAYHGSTRPRARREASIAAPVVAEMRPTTLDELAPEEAIEEFDAVFPNRRETVARLPVPDQAAIRDDGVTFCWCPIDQAIAEAGPLTRSVLAAMRTRLVGDKRHVYVDSKIQYLARGDVPVDSQHWHIDGSITVRGARVERRGHGVMHDMKARLRGGVSPPRYLSYQSSQHCATLFVAQPLTLRLPAMIPDFDALDRRVRAIDPRCAAQPQAAIIRFDGLSLHRAVAARGAGWRLWIRCVETDRRAEVDAAVIECYGTVFRTMNGA